MKLSKDLKKQKGFTVVAVILTIVVIIAALGVWVMSGQSNTNDLTSRKSNIDASSIINDANTIQTAYDALRIKGISNVTMTFVPNSNNVNNMLNPTTGINVPVPAKNLLASDLGAGEGYWVYNANHLSGANVGYNGSGGPADKHDAAIVLVGVKDNVCASLNKILHKSTDIPSGGSGLISNMLATPGQVTTGSTVTNPMSAQELNLYTVLNVWNWNKGCISLSPIINGEETVLKDHNMYFHILEGF